MLSPRAQQLLFSRLGARKGWHWLPRSPPSLPHWWAHSGDRLEGQFHPDSHQTFPPGLERPQECRHETLVSHSLHLSVLAHISCPHRPSDHFAGLASGSFSSQWSRQVFSVISRTCSSQSQSPRPHCPLSLCHRLVGSRVSLAPPEEDGQEGLSGPFWPRGQLWLLFDPCPVGQWVRMGRKGHHAPLAHLDNEFPQLPLGYSTAASLVHGAALLLLAVVTQTLLGWYLWLPPPPLSLVSTGKGLENKKLCVPASQDLCGGLLDSLEDIGGPPESGKLLIDTSPSCTSRTGRHNPGMPSLVPTLSLPSGCSSMGALTTRTCPWLGAHSSPPIPSHKQVGTSGHILPASHKWRAFCQQLFWSVPRTVPHTVLGTLWVPAAYSLAGSNC